MSIFNLSRNQIISPNTSFLNIKAGKYKSEIYQAFCLSGLITFIKSFFRHSNVITFFENQLLNDFFSFISIPQVAWALSYCSFFLFTYFVWLFNGMTRGKKTGLKSMCFVFMSISTYGVFLHILFAITQFVMPKKFNLFIFYLFFIGIAFLFSYALTKINELPMFKAAFLLIISAIPIVFIFGITGIFPFLMWLI